LSAERERREQGKWRTTIIMAASSSMASYVRSSSPLHQPVAILGQHIADLGKSLGSSPLPVREKAGIRVNDRSIATRDARVVAALPGLSEPSLAWNSIKRCEFFDSNDKKSSNYHIVKKLNSRNKPKSTTHQNRSTLAVRT
jgi:hypothetical protein